MNALSLTVPRRLPASVATLALIFAAIGCAPAAITNGDDSPARVEADRDFDPRPPNPDPRIGLSAGLFDAGQATWNMRLLSATPPPEAFVGVTNSDLAFSGPYAIQGNYNGIIVWDISNPRAPELVTAYVCPASQSDVSVYENLMFVSGEGLGGRLDCGTEGVQEAVSQDRLRGIRIFDITDIRNPRYVANVQTCRGSHTHSVLKDPDDDENVYVYVSGSAPVRPAEEVPGCSDAPLDEDPNSALFRIEVIRVPLANPAAAAIVSSPRIFNELDPAPRHGLGPADIAEIEAARAAGAFVVNVAGQPRVLSSRTVRQRLDEIVAARGGTGEPTAADSAALRDRLPEIGAEMFQRQNERVRTGPTQCHDITLYPQLGVAGGACEGYGMLLDIRDPANPVRLQAVADSNFSYWHSATFNNDGTTILFSDEWGGGGGAKCRADDPREWGADAIFAIEGGRMVFKSYYKLPAPQTAQENCVAHNGSLVPIPGRDVMVQGWYQGGVSVFDFTDPANPYEIAFFDRGPVDAEVMRGGGSWSVYWYNGVIVNSEISRGLDVLELAPSAHLTENEIEASRTVVLSELNAQGQPHFEWPPSFALVRAYVDQLERSRGLSAGRVEAVRGTVAAAEAARGSARAGALTALAAELEGEAGASSDASKVRMLAAALRDLAAAR